MALAGFYAARGQVRSRDARRGTGGVVAPADPAGSFHGRDLLRREDPQGREPVGPGTGVVHPGGHRARRTARWSLSPDYVDAMIVKNILMRHQANLEATRAARARADCRRPTRLRRARARAAAAEPGDGQRQRRQRAGHDRSRQWADVAGRFRRRHLPDSGRSGCAPAPRPSGPEPDGGRHDAGAGRRRHQEPTKLVNVPPVYPEEAKAAGTSGRGDHRGGD